MREENGIRLPKRVWNIIDQVRDGNRLCKFLRPSQGLEDDTQFFIEPHGYRVATKSAQEAMWIIENACVSLVILDVELGNENGLDLLVRLKQAHPNLPVIMFTSHGGDVDLMTDALASGADGYLSKNESIGILMKEVERALQRAHTV